TFRRAIPRVASDALGAEARALATAMGQARDLDVFEDETLKPLASSGQQRLLDPALAQLVRERAKAQQDAASALSPPGFTSFVLDLSRWLDLRVWRQGSGVSATHARSAGDATERGSAADARIESPTRADRDSAGGRASKRASSAASSGSTKGHEVRDRALEQQRANVRRFASATLERRHRAVLAAGALPSSMEPVARHELRIAIKKLRYAAEFFSSLYPNKASAPYLDAMAELQQALGTLNDIATGERLAEERFVGVLDPAAGALLAGWRLGLGSATLQDADRAWGHFSRAEGFW
ncbi:MAG: CHAD domain-containing protein, partial [Proteobacteria bacterium]|nr:CHAD domain-containing protein [Burkholderiales bacterium]